MKTVTQRVQYASVTIDGQVKSKIGKGLLILVVNMGPKLQWDRSLFDKTVWLPFENIKVPAPKDTDTVDNPLLADQSGS